MCLRAVEKKAVVLPEGLDLQSYAAHYAPKVKTMIDGMRNVVAYGVREHFMCE